MIVIGCIAIYIIVLNIVGLTYMKIDKERATHHKWRIPEKHLWIIAIIGGALGLTIGMKLFRHKTKHFQFKWGLPFLAAINILFYIYLYGVFKDIHFS
jgi:uncharacterized membrane protein YsdA (DUF1294 family)